MEVSLTPSEIMSAAIAGVMRHTENIKNGKKPTYGINPEKDWQAHIDGALGECAVAKAMDRYWAGKGTMGGADVGKVFQIRTNPRANGDLIMHPADKDDVPYILVCGLNGKYVIKGWLYGRDCKKDDYWGDKANNGRPAFWVPQEDLIPFDNLEFALGLTRVEINK